MSTYRCMVLNEVKQITHSMCIDGSIQSTSNEWSRLLDMLEIQFGNSNGCAFTVIAIIVEGTTRTHTHTHTHTHTYPGILLPCQTLPGAEFRHWKAQDDLGLTLTWLGLVWHTLQVTAIGWHKYWQMFVFVFVSWLYKWQLIFDDLSNISRANFILSEYACRRAIGDQVAD